MWERVWSAEPSSTTRHTTTPASTDTRWVSFLPGGLVAMCPTPYTCFPWSGASGRWRRNCCLSMPLPLVSGRRGLWVQRRKLSTWSSSSCSFLSQKELGRLEGKSSSCRAPPAVSCRMLDCVFWEGDPRYPSTWRCQLLVVTQRTCGS